LSKFGRIALVKIREGTRQDKAREKSKVQDEKRAVGKLCGGTRGRRGEQRKR
jgi:hypothetical protein